jgi:hypothetical protein
MAPVNGFVRIGSGRDAADVAFGTIFGLAQMQEMSVWAEDGTPEPTAGKTPPDDAAISTA